MNNPILFLASIYIFLSPSDACGQSLQFTFVGIIGHEGTGVGQLMSPSAVAIDPAGNVYVADTGNNRIQQFNRNGRYVRHLGGFGFNTEQFNQPMGLDATGLDVYVADTQNRRIQRLDRQLNFLGAFSSEPDAREDLEDGIGFPGGIAISNTGDMYVTDIENEEVIKMNTSGRIEIRFGGFSHGEGRLRKPAGVAVYRSGNIYVADTGNDRIAVFDTFGGFLRAFGVDTLKAPEGVDVGGQGRIYVADTGQDRVLILSPEGETLLTFGVRGSGIGSFRGPRDIAVGQDGAVYIADTGNHRIQKFVVSKAEE